MMIDYVVLALPVALFLYFLRKLFLSLKDVSEARAKHDEVAKNFDVVMPSQTRLLAITSDYKGIQKTYKDERSRLMSHRKKMELYEVGSGSTDSVVFSESTKEESVSDLEAQLEKVKANLKRMVSEKTACESEYKGKIEVNGSKAEANKFFNRDIKLRLRCLDKEFLLAHAVIDWNNVDRLKKRCELVFEEINEAGKLMKTKIRKQYFDLKILELDLSFRISNAKQKIKEAEREERAAERESLRDEERLKAELKRAEKQRVQMEKLIAQEVKKLKGASGDKLLKLESLKARLMELETREKRAKAMSEITRSGYVYIISNDGSFGDSFCKIGMTRRLDPMDRVRELGDASVPYEFEVHALAYSSDAPALEKTLHDAFEASRVNLVNRRREFFFVEASEAVEKLKQVDPNAEFLPLH